MFSAIAIKLVTVLLGYVMETHVLNNESYIEIDGAPSWYMKNEDSNKYYSFYVMNGNIEEIEKAKELLHVKMEKNLRSDLDIALHKSFEEFSEDERAMAFNLTKLDDLDYFVKTYTVMPYLTHTKKDVIYVGGYIPKSEIEHYLLKNIEKTKIKISDKKSDDMMMELRQRQ